MWKGRRDFVQILRRRPGGLFLDSQVVKKVRIKTCLIRFECAA
jgi:hypothetical protein